MARSAAVLARFVLAASIVAGCRRTPKPTAISPSSSPTIPPVTSAADRLAPGEPPPGVDKAFDLILPRGARIQRKFGTSIYVAVPMPPEEVASFVRKQGESDEPLVGPEKTVLTRVVVRGAFPDHHLRVEIAGPPFGNESEVVVERVVERPPPPPEPVDEAMRKVGLTPDGKLLDPKHLD